jgi:hypoxanthine phosphoribosyltransferase
MADLYFNSTTLSSLTEQQLDELGFKIGQENQAKAARANETVKKLLRFASKEEVDNAVKKIGDQIISCSDFANSPPILMVMLKGGVPFCASLMAYLDEQHFNYLLSYLSVSTYGDKQHAGQSKVEFPPADPCLVRQKIILVDDVMDTGSSVNKAIELLTQFCYVRKQDIYTAMLVDKPLCRHEKFQQMKPSFCGFIREDKNFLVGMGLDEQKFKRMYQGGGLYYYPNTGNKNC